MKFPKTKIKSTETQFENAKTQFENAKTQFTGDLLAWTGCAMRSKESPAGLHFTRPSMVITFCLTILSLDKATDKATGATTRQKEQKGKKSRPKMFCCQIGK